MSWTISGRIIWHPGTYMVSFDGSPLNNYLSDIYVTYHHYEITLPPNDTLSFNAAYRHSPT